MKGKKKKRKKKPQNIQEVVLGIKIYIFTVQLDSLQTLCPKPFKYFAAAPLVAPLAVWEQVWSRINPSSQVQPPAGGSACSPPPASAKKEEEEEEESSAISFLSIFIFIYMHTDTHTRDDF